MAEIEEHIEADRVPGMAVAVVVGGRLAYAEGFGRVRAAEGSDPVTAGTVFRWASVSKVHTAMAALSLVDEGILDLDDPVSAWLPEFSPEDDGYGHDTMTVRHLLTHTAGLPDDLPWSCSIDDDLLVQWFDAPYPWPVWSTPGAVWNYSNTGYNLLGAVLERADGRAFPDLVAARVLDPLGMRTATYRATEAVALPHAIGHELDPEAPDQPRLFPPDAYDCARSRPASALHGSVIDLARSLEAILADPADLGPQRQTGLWGNGQHRYGLGLYTFPYKGLEVWTHAGWVAGFEAQFTLVPDLGFGVVVTTNGVWARTSDVRWRAVDLFLDLAPHLEERDVVLTGADAQRVWTGSYDQPFDLGPDHTRGRLEVEQVALWLVVDFPGTDSDGYLVQVDGGAYSYAIDGRTEAMNFKTDPWGGRWMVQRGWVAGAVPGP